jgi:ribosome-associated protein
LLDRIEKIVNILDSKKATDIASFDLQGKEYFVDCVVIANTLNQKHAYALLNYLKSDLKPAEHFVNVEESDDWTAIDLGDIMIHLMSPEYRKMYDLDDFLTNFDKYSQQVAK